MRSRSPAGWGCRRKRPDTAARLRGKARAERDSGQRAILRSSDSVTGPCRSDEAAPMLRGCLWRDQWNSRSAAVQQIGLDGEFVVTESMLLCRTQFECERAGTTTPRFSKRFSRSASISSSVRAREYTRCGARSCLADLSEEVVIGIRVDADQRKGRHDLHTSLA